MMELFGDPQFLNLLAQRRREDWGDVQSAPFNFGAVPPEKLEKLMKRRSPPGYDVFKMDHGWEWGRCGEPVDAEVPIGLTKAEARAAAWRDIMTRQGEGPR